MASKLHTYDDNIHCAIQGDILNIFLEASAGYYNRGVFSDVSISHAQQIEHQLPTTSHYTYESQYSHHHHHSDQCQPPNHSQFPNEYVRTTSIVHNHSSPSSNAVDYSPEHFIQEPRSYALN